MPKASKKARASPGQQPTLSTIYKRKAVKADVETPAVPKIMEVIDESAAKWGAVDSWNLSIESEEDDEDDLDFLRSYRALLTEKPNLVPKQELCERVIAILEKEGKEGDENTALQQTAAYDVLKLAHRNQPPVQVRMHNGNIGEPYLLINPLAWNPIQSDSRADSDERQGAHRLRRGATADATRFSDLLACASKACDGSPASRAKAGGRLLLLKLYIDVLYDDFCCRAIVFRAYQSLNVLNESMIARLLDTIPLTNSIKRSHFLDDLFEMLTKCTPDTETAEVCGVTEIVHLAHYLLGMTMELHDMLEQYGAFASSQNMRKEIDDGIEQILKNKILDEAAVEPIEAFAYFLQKMISPKHKLRIIRRMLVPAVNKRTLSAPNLHQGGLGGHTGALEVLQYIEADAKESMTKSLKYDGGHIAANALALFLSHSALVASEIYTEESPEYNKVAELLPKAADKLRFAVKEKQLSASCFLEVDVEAALTSAIFRFENRDGKR
ncbi:hypothetical protein CYMTET_21078 [Cymbomonas tetramitiformis]|uniref:Uncharacterized protein n=1 Tax=Cymbomonas tetramitiformis TaxID=36881 RepID=A0AAE0L3L0_9CHLO|nr:hypothetical protein CYMTET_21078 [Cymbomonas tetramitiformis]